MAIIKAITQYHIFDKVFPSSEQAQEYCEEKLAEKICEELCKGLVLSAGEKLKILTNIHKLSFSERRAYADLFIIHTEGE